MIAWFRRRRARRRWETLLLEAEECVTRHRDPGRAEAALREALLVGEIAFGRHARELNLPLYALAAARLEEAPDEAVSLAQRLMANLRGGTPRLEGEPTSTQGAALLASAVERTEPWKEAHLAALLEFREAALEGGDQEALGLAENQLGLHFGRAGDRARAATHFDRAIELRAATFGRRSVETLESRYNRATYRDDTQPLSEVEETYGEIIETLSATPAARASELVESALHNLGALCEETGRDDTALRHFTRSLELRSSRLRSDHPALRPTLVRLAQLHHRKGRVLSALDAYERAHAVAVTELGEDHPITVALAAWKSEVTMGLSESAIRRPLLHAP